MPEEKKSYRVSFIGQDGDAPSWCFDFATLPEALAKVSEVITTWRGYYAGHLSEYTATHFRHLLHFDTFSTKDYTEADKWRRQPLMHYGELSPEGKERLSHLR